MQMCSGESERIYENFGLGEIWRGCNNVNDKVSPARVRLCWGFALLQYRVRGERVSGKDNDVGRMNLLGYLGKSKKKGGNLSFYLRIFCG